MWSDVAAGAPSSASAFFSISYQYSGAGQGIFV
jgi:hypothetical protein